MAHSFIKEQVFVAQPMQPAVIVPDWIKNKPTEAPKSVNEPWPNAKPVNQPAFHLPNEEEFKKAFGAELSKLPDDPFAAACRIISDTKIALWVSRNWLADPIVMASKELYAQKSKSNKQLLSKEELAEKVLDLAEDQFLEGKDRVSAFKLYSEIAGYTGKVEIDASTNNILNKNEMKIVFVKADNEQKEPKETKTIEHEKQPESGLKFKLVK